MRNININSSNYQLRELRHENLSSGIRHIPGLPSEVLKSFRTPYFTPVLTLYNLSSQYSILFLGYIPERDRKPKCFNFLLPPYLNYVIIETDPQDTKNLKNFALT